MDKIVAAICAAIGVLVTALLVGAALSLLMAFPIKWCWNYTAWVFHAPLIEWGHAWCLSFLAGQFFRRSTATPSKKD